MAPRKKTGEIGPLKVSFGQDGTTIEQVDAALPSKKEELELFFGERFADAFNRKAPLPGVRIENLEQQDTSDLDFRITSSRAKYLELAELTPLSEAFGREARATGELGLLEYATWIYDNIIKSKAEKYGATAGHTFLLLYVTHPQFLPSDSLIACLQSLCFWRGCRFAGVFVFSTTGGPVKEALELIHKVSPAASTSVWPAKPEAFHGMKYWNVGHLAQPTERGVVFGPVQTGPSSST